MIPDWRDAFPDGTLVTFRDGPDTTLTGTVEDSWLLDYCLRVRVQDRVLALTRDDLVSQRPRPLPPKVGRTRPVTLPPLTPAQAVQVHLRRGGAQSREEARAIACALVRRAGTVASVKDLLPRELAYLEDLLSGLSNDEVRDQVEDARRDLALGRVAA